jgi:hypothetical protein
MNVPEKVYHGTCFHFIWRKTIMENRSARPMLGMHHFTSRGASFLYPSNCPYLTPPDIFLL